MSSDNTFQPLTDDELEDAKRVLAVLGKKTGFTSKVLWDALDELEERRRIERGNFPYDDQRQLELPKTYNNRGHRYERTQFPSGDLEKAFADQWEEENEERRGINYGQGLLQDLFIERRSVLTQWTTVISRRERWIAATVIQWLGTNCGFAFLIRCLNKCGYSIEETTQRDNVRNMRSLKERAELLNNQEDGLHQAQEWLLEEIKRTLEHVRFRATMRHPRKGFL